MKKKPKYYTRKYKYFIILYRDRRNVNTLKKSVKKETIMRYWREFIKKDPPKFIKRTCGKRNHEIRNELALIFPKHWRTKPSYTKDSLGRNVEIEFGDKKQFIKEIIPYWEEELIYDHSISKRIKFDVLMEQILDIHEIGQIFTLNNKLFVQIDDNIKMYGNKNIIDAERLLNAIKEEFLSKKRSNFIFIKDVSFEQRVHLYDFLGKLGYDREKLFRHYSY